MRKLTSILLIFLTFPILQFGQQEEEKRTPKIVLLTFSVNAFDEESKKINTGLKGLKGVIDKELKKSFQIVEELPDEITYSDIELPEVTIDPVVEPETNKKLEQLCKQDWDGLVFGHFHQEDKLIVVSRIYLSKKKYTNLTKDERIISSPEIEIPTTNLDQRSLESHTTQSLQELIKAIKTKRPEVFGLVKKEVKKEPAPKIMEPPKQEPKPKPQDTKPAQVKEQTTIEEDYGVVPLTARNVYQMIIDNGFYCEIVEGSGFHGEGLTGITIPKNGIFKEKRVVTAVNKDGLIKTESKLVKQDGDEILLWWFPGKKIKCSYQSAEQIIDRLNNEFKDKNKRWRIPTLMELFSVVRFEDPNHFPPAFKFATKDKDLIFWTSTPVKKEGTVLNNDKNKKAYFVVRSLYGKSNGQYSLTFALLNIKGNPPNEAYILPVYSDKVYAYRETLLSTGTKVPGFDDKYVPGFDDPPDNSPVNEPVPSTPPVKKAPASNHSPQITTKSNSSTKIPGFDDVPDAATPPPTPSKKDPYGSDFRSFKSGRKSAGTVSIALFPYIHRETPHEKKKLLDDLNNEIEGALDWLKGHLRDNYNPKLKLKIIKKNLSDINDITGFYKSLSDTKASEKDQLNNIKTNIMIPSDIDVIVTVKHYEYKSNPIQSHPNIHSPVRIIHTFIPVIIDGFNNKIRLGNYDNLQNQGRVQFEPIIQNITRTISKIIRSQFEKTQ